GPVGAGGGRERLVRQQPDERIEVRVHRIDAVQVGLDHFTAADLTAADHRRQFDRALAPQLAHAPSLQVKIEANVCHHIDSGEEVATVYFGRSHVARAGSA